jgi:hypothetical protein
LARTHHPVRRGAALDRFRPWTEIRNYREVGREPGTASAPCARGTTWRRFHAQRVERALGPGASHLTERHTSKRSVCADIR